MAKHVKFLAHAALFLAIPFVFALLGATQGFGNRSVTAAWIFGALPSPFVFIGLKWFCVIHGKRFQRRQPSVPIWIKIGGGLVVIWFVLMIVFAIIVPKLGSSRMNASETIAAREIRTINEAETQYMPQFGKYAPTLSELGPPTRGASSSRAVDLIPSSLASGEKDRYVFTLTRAPLGYTVNANLKVYNSTGRRSFFSNQTMIIRQNWSMEPATDTSPELTVIRQAAVLWLVAVPLETDRINSRAGGFR